MTALQLSLLSMFLVNARDETYETAVLWPFIWQLPQVHVFLVCLSDVPENRLDTVLFCFVQRYFWDMRVLGLRTTALQRILTTDAQCGSGAFCIIWKKIGT